MLWIKSHELKAPAFASLALAFASFGDAFLYPFLPVNGSVVGVPVVWVGVLLSINRFVRIISNGWMVHLFSRYGLRSIMILAVVLALVSTAGYAFATSVIVWLILRVSWGLAFSAMRLGTIGYAIDQQRPGLTLGITKSLQEAGPMLALFITPLLVINLNSSHVFLVLFALSIPALYFAWSLPIKNDKIKSQEKSSLKFPSTYNLITLLLAVLIDGIVIVVLGTLFLTYDLELTPVMAAALAAFYLGYRRICVVILAPLGGWIADKIGVDIVFNASMAFIVGGLFMLVGGWIEFGVILAFTFYGINSAVTPGAVSQGSSHALSAVAENASWRDLGAAFGTLLGGILLSSQHLNTTLIIAIFILIIILLFHVGRNLNGAKIIVVWK